MLHGSDQQHPLCLFLVHRWRCASGAPGYCCMSTPASRAFTGTSSHSKGWQQQQQQQGRDPAQRMGQV